MKATQEALVIKIDQVQRHGDLSILVVAIEPVYSAFQQLPEVVSFEGRFFGKSAWNSDRGQAYFRSDYKFATVVRS